jgi:ribosomal protein L11 methylase PrmA
VSESSGWYTVRVHPGSNPDAVSAALFEAGAQGLQEVAGTFVTHVDGAETANALLCAAMAASPDARVETEPLPDVDWTEKWKQSVRAQSLGSLTVAPVDLILANIISSVLLDLLPSLPLALADDGVAILSGMLFVEREMMVRAFTDSGWTLVDEDHEDAWWSATIARR